MTSPEPLRAAIYARVSTFDQQPENQLAELRRYVQARHWSAQEYVDQGISGAKDRRPALDQLVRDAKQEVRCPSLLALRSARQKPQAPRDVARRTPSAWDCLCEPS